ncbi:MAG: CopG family transcriptional regulator [Armatimonadetes bacterium RBG_19FT_COMBO_69_19]|jgi:hypothetical protein|nr:MAG: CopG family transcriptional regulator [Armatimonadetes bacterium RBG_19FT_COMBO_69_19]
MKPVPKRATIYLDPHLHRVLKHKAAETERSVSDLVNDAIRLSLREDADDLAAFDERAHEPSVSFEVALKDLRKRGRL